MADALNCQKKTAETVIKCKADYLLSVKENHPELMETIENFVQDNTLQSTMETTIKTEKNRDRYEKRTAYITSNIDWVYQKEQWENLCCIGAIHTEFESKKGKSNEWHYYISSRKLSAQELLHYARMEWTVETMHWLLDIHFEEDWCRVEDKNIQQNLNILRKAAINLIKLFKSDTQSKKPFLKLCLIVYLNHIIF